MKFIRNLLFDFRQGIFLNSALLLAPMVIAVMAFLDFAGKEHRYLLDGRITENVSLGDYWFYLYGGMHEYIPSPDNAFQFPIVWMVVFLVIPFALLNYPFKDMFGVGQQVLVQSGSRTSWWLSKCCWNFFGTILYHMIMQAMGLLLFLIFQMDISNQIHMDFIKVVFDTTGQEIWNPSGLLLSVLILPLFVSIAINMLQMTLSLFMKPVFSFFVVACLLLTSAYRLSPLLLGNYAMAYRYNWMLKKGVSISVGFTVSVALLLVSILLGLVKFRFYDILERE